MEQYNLRVPDISSDQAEKWVDEMTKRMGPFLEEGRKSLMPCPWYNPDIFPPRRRFF